MANVKITDLTALAAADVTSTDVFVVVDLSADQTKKITVADATTALAAANDFVTYTQLNSNLNTTTANVTAVEARRVANIAGAISTVLTGDLTASRAMVTNGSGKIAISDVTATELSHLDGVSSAIQTQLDAKIATTASASNDFVTFQRLNANINIVQDNVAAASSNAITSGDTVVNTIDPIITFVTNGTEKGRFTADGNLLLGVTASRHFVDVRGSANTGDLVATGIGTSGNTHPTEGLTFGHPANVFIRHHTASGAGNVIIGDPTLTSSFNLDVRGTANTGALTSTGITGSALTASSALQTDASKGLESSTVTTTELAFVSGVSSAIQTQLDAKQATITTSNLMITTTTANTYNIGATVASINETDVYLDGVYQTKSQYVLANSSHSIQFIASALVAGLTLETVVRT